MLPPEDTLTLEVKHETHRKNEPLLGGGVGITFGTPNLETIFCGAVMIVISWVMWEACKLHEEQRYTV